MDPGGPQVGEPGRPGQGAELTPGIRLLARLARVAELACQQTGISLSQYRLLVSITGRPQRASELAGHVGVSRPALTSLVDGLEQAGFLRRAPVMNDRRGIQLVVTDAGREAVERADAALSRRLGELAGPDAARVVGELVAAIDAALDRES
jgi:DNA-binding MarR family transcriptional regulator